MFGLFARTVPSTVLRSRATHSSARVLSSQPAPPTNLDAGEKTIFEKLSERFQPSELFVQDVSGAFFISYR